MHDQAFIMSNNMSRPRSENGNRTEPKTLSV
jgi:hypothetical protein